MICDIKQMVWKSILGRYSANTSVMWKLEEKLENDFTVREEILCSAGKGATCKKV